MIDDIRSTVAKYMPGENIDENTSVQEYEKQTKPVYEDEKWTIYNEDRLDLVSDD